MRKVEVGLESPNIFDSGTYEFRMIIKNDLSSADGDAGNLELTKGAGLTTDAENSQNIIIHITKAQTAAMDPLKRYFYDLTVISPAAEETTVMTGRLFIERGVDSP